MQIFNIQHEAKTHFSTLKMSFQNQIPDDFQAMISIIELLHCGVCNFTIGQSAGEPHNKKSVHKASFHKMLANLSELRIL